MFGWSFKGPSSSELTTSSVAAASYFLVFLVFLPERISFASSLPTAQEDAGSTSVPYNWFFVPTSGMPGGVYSGILASPKSKSLMVP